MNAFLSKAVFRLRHPVWMAKLRVWRYKFFGLVAGSCNCAGPGFWISWPHNVKMGNNCIFESQVVFKIDHPFCRQVILDIGDRVFIGARTEFNLSAGATIGSGAMIASGCHIIDHDHGTAANQPIASQPGVASKVVIGADCWIGANSVILKGVTVGFGSVIAAGAVVTQSVPEMEIWGGVPARRIGARKPWQESN